MWNSGIWRTHGIAWKNVSSVLQASATGSWGRGIRRERSLQLSARLGCSFPGTSAPPELHPPGGIPRSFVAALYVRYRWALSREEIAERNLSRFQSDFSTLRFKVRKPEDFHPLTRRRLRNETAFCFEAIGKSVADRVADHVFIVLSQKSSYPLR